MSALATRGHSVRRPDRRVRKTRRALGDALFGLLTEKRYEAITVQDVIDRADVSRSTFYAHFVDKDELFLDAFRDIRHDSAQARPSDHPSAEPFGWSIGMFRWSLGLLGEFSSAGDVYRTTVGSQGCLLAVEEMERELEDLVRQDLARLASMRPDRVPDIVVGFVVRAFMCILTWWLDAPESGSPEEVDQMFRVLTVPGAAAALGVAIPPDPPVLPTGLLARRPESRAARFSIPQGRIKEHIRIPVEDA
jgi:AcrR family transcriptional regulator